MRDLQHRKRLYNKRKTFTLNPAWRRFGEVEVMQVI
jgi:hypothetical protein